MSSRALAAGQPAAEREAARLTRSLPSLHTLSGGRATHGAVEHYVEMALVSAMTASSNHELQGLAPEPDVTEPLLPPLPPPPPPPPPLVPARDSSGRGRRRVQRKRYPRTPLPRGALVAATSAPPAPSHDATSALPAPSHGAVDTDYQSAYAPSQLTDSDDQTTKKAATATAPSSGNVSRAGVRETGHGGPGRPEPRPEGSELILVSRRALERLLRRPLTDAELDTTGGPDQSGDRYRNGGRNSDWDLNRNRERAKDRNREQDDTMHISGLQPLEDTTVANDDSLPIRSETAGVLADTEDNLGDSVGTLGETEPLGDETRTLADTETDTVETLWNTRETLEDTAEVSEIGAALLGDTPGAAEGRRGWVPEPASPEWDPSAEPHRRPLLSARALVVSPRSHSVV